MISNCYPALILGIILSGCQSAQLEKQTDPLMGKEYCVVNRMQLSSLENSSHAYLTLKYPKTNSDLKKPIKAMLDFVQPGHTFHQNTHQILYLTINGTRHELPIIHNLINQEVLDNTLTFYLPSGRSVQTGPIKKVTRKKISTLISYEVFSLLRSNETVYIEILSPSSQSALQAHKKPVILRLTRDNLQLIEKFKNDCVDHFKLK